MDIDEYLNPQLPETTLNDAFHIVLRQFDEKYAEIGALGIKCRIFRNPNGLPEDGFRFLQVYTCDEILETQRQKCFVNPRNVSIFSVHTIVSGEKTIKVPERFMYYNHYMFLNKPHRAREQTLCSDSSIERIYIRLAGAHQL